MKRLLLSICIFFSPLAQANLLLEPYLGYGISTGENSATIKTEYDQSTPFLGARLGYQTLGFMAGLDYTKGLEADFESKTGATTTKQDADQQTFGIFVGYNLPVMFRTWVGYYFNSTIGLANNSEFSGSGYGIGLGFTGLPFLSLNLEYRMLTFDEEENSAGVTSKLTGSSEIDYNQVMLSISVPLTF